MQFHLNDQNIPIGWCLLSESLTAANSIFEMDAADPDESSFNLYGSGLVWLISAKATWIKKETRTWEAWTGSLW